MRVASASASTLVAVGRMLVMTCLVWTVGSMIDSSTSMAMAFVPPHAAPVATRGTTTQSPQQHHLQQQRQQSLTLFHRFNPLRIDSDGSRRKMKSNAAATAMTPAPTASSGGVDGSAMVKYALAILIQVSLIQIVFKGMDLWIVPHVRIPFAVNAFFMYFLALKSRVFNPLSNRRPKPQTKEIQGVAMQRKMPTWTPPGVVFPIVWLLLIGPLRAVTSAMIIQANGGLYSTPALLSLILHLSIGDVWNTINNVERRYGTSVLGILGVWISAACAAWQFSRVVPLAGKLLSLKLVWLTIASSLIVRTWQLNPDPSKGEKSPLLPTKGDGRRTQFEWFQGKQVE